MIETRLPQPPLSSQQGAPKRFSPWSDGAVLLGLAAVTVGIVELAARWAAPMTPTVEIDLSPWALPGYAALSTARMALAYLLSLSFSLVYARIVVTSRLAERVLIPILDILQSIPILSFLPGVVLALVALLPGSNVGLELAAIVLIFTSQAWNMTFGFYHSLITIPSELREVAAIHRLNGWQRFTRLELPFGAIPLVWNSMMSWAGGWFFLMAAEQFTLGEQSFQLPGLGAYLRTAADEGDIAALFLGLATLVAVIVLLDQLVWRPVIAWADRFKVEQTEAALAPTSAVLTALRRSAVLDWLGRRFLQPLARLLDTLGGRLFPAPSRSSSPSPSRPGTRFLILAGGALAGAGVAAFGIWGIVGAARLLAALSPGDWLAIGVATGATFLRVAAALLIGAAWTIPVGVAIGLNPRLAQRAQPIVQVVASIPATALFPALLLLLLTLPGGLNVAAVGLMLLGTQWYVLFNVIAGAMAIPNDLREAAALYRLTGWRRWRYLILPGIFPSFLTGVITATGGAWNASIVAEFVTFGQETIQTVGLGATIAQSAAAGDFSTLLASTLTMSAVVVLINRLLWRRLAALSERRFRLD
ncbi:MAG: ABC transporter permease subunit [Chloroflexota bacterium]|nr:ABC transporter permease subunit [Dehalococcoidia bacterium]MDW8252365.1 ABC transporter permease subunit [Chloroflexota bacterium]